jgi:superfamily I DNA/RNA helicase
MGELEKDPQLTFSSGRMKGRPLFPWSYGVVLANISRRAFESADLAEVLEPHRVICQDEMTESVAAEAFQQRLWDMFHVGGFGHLSLPQIDRIRWHLFPEIRLPGKQIGLFDELAEVETPDLMRVLDLQQEQLARSLGGGHRVIHGVAGSGKTLILGYRAEHLARACAKPVLVLCYNKTLARRLEHWMQAKGVADKVHIASFHAWCHHQLTAYHVGLPPGDANHHGYWDALVQRVIQGVDRHLIPAGQYDAVLIDEGHDFHPEWLKLVVRMVDPLTDSLLVLYDDAQSIYDTGKRRDFSFRSVDIRAQGRTTILKVNYRNTREILDFAAGFARQLLQPAEAGDDGVPRLAPVSAGRSGDPPKRVKLPSLRDEAAYLVDQIKAAHRAGTPWRDMAVLYRHWEPVGKTVNSVFRLAGIPLTWKDNIRFGDKQDTVKLLPFHSGKGLEFPLVAIPGLTDNTSTSEEEIRLLYVAMTRATQRLLVTGA